MILWHQVVGTQWVWINDLSNLTVFGLLVSIFGLYKHHNCTEKGCWRIGHHTVEGTTYKTCHKHTTENVHMKLFLHHSEKRPEQHALLNK